MKKLQKEIERLVNEYVQEGDKELFRAQLEYLVLIAQRVQIIKDREATKEIIETLRKFHEENE
jgi:iron-sulfur cluster repair protein YtfE (RIC family)